MPWDGNITELNERGIYKSLNGKASLFIVMLPKLDVQLFV